MPGLVPRERLRSWRNLLLPVLAQKACRMFKRYSPLVYSSSKIAFPSSNIPKLTYLCNSELCWNTSVLVIFCFLLFNFVYFFTLVVFCLSCKSCWALGSPSVLIMQENSLMKEQMEVVLRENAILKRAVAIQHDRQKEQEEQNQEVQHLRQMVSQYQEQVRTLEVSRSFSFSGNCKILCLSLQNI